MTGLRLRVVLGGILLLALGIAIGSAGAQQGAAPAARRDLQKERLAVIKEIQILTTAAYGGGVSDIGAVHEARVQLLDAEIELAENREEQLKLRTDMVHEATMWEQNVKRMIEGRERPAIDAMRAKVFRLNAQIALEKARGEAVATKGGK